MLWNDEADVPVNAYANRGRFDRLIGVERATITSDTYGGEVPAWTVREQAWAQVRFGSAREKREAAQETAIQSATFEVMPTTTLLTTQVKDRITFDGSEWDITEVAKLERNLLRFTAVRTVQ